MWGCVVQGALWAQVQNTFRSYLRLKVTCCGEITNSENQKIVAKRWKSTWHNQFVFLMERSSAHTSINYIIYGTKHTVVLVQFRWPIIMFVFSTLKTIQSKTHYIFWASGLLFIFHYVKTWNLSTWLPLRIAGCLAQLCETVDQFVPGLVRRVFPAVSLESVKGIIAESLAFRCKQCRRWREGGGEGRGVGVIDGAAVS